MDKMKQEWQAWQELCAEFRSVTGLDVNDDTCANLFRLVRIWGERLAKLRREQPINVSDEIIYREHAQGIAEAVQDKRASV